MRRRNDTKLRFALVSIDIENCFNAIDRDRLIDECLASAEPGIRAERKAGGSRIPTCEASVGRAVRGRMVEQRAQLF